MKKTLVAITLCLFAALAAAQTTGRLTGVVKSKDGKPLAGAVVKIASKSSSKISFTVKTDKKGTYSQIGLAVGTYIVEAGMEGYLPQSAEWKVGLGEATELDFDLAEIPKMAAAPAETAGSKDYKQARELFDAGKYEEAVAALDKAIAAEPTNAIYLVKLGLVYEKLDKTGDSEAAFAKAVAADPSSFPGWFSLGRARTAQKNYAGAIEAFEHATQVNPNEPEALYSLGSAYFNSSKIPEAVVAFEKAVQLKPDHTLALYWLGTGYVNLGKIPEAKAVFEKFLQIAPPTDPNVPQAKLMLDALAKM